MKRNFIILLAVLTNINAFPQNKDGVFNFKSDKTVPKQAVFIDIFPSLEGVWEGKVGAGLFYERSIHRYFSLVGEANFYTDFDGESAYSFIGHSRMYPFQATLRNIFADIGLGYRRSTLEEDNVHSLDACASVGWKFIIAKGFVIEPNVGYRQSLYTIKGHESQKGGITINLSLGWTFK